MMLGHNNHCQRKTAWQNRRHERLQRHRIDGAWVLPCLPCWFFHLDAGAALAQERRTLFDFLFGGNRGSQREEGYERQREQRIIREPRQRNRPTTGRVVAPPAAPTTASKAEPVQKFDNARRVLVIGDFTAMSLGSGLEDAFAPDPSIVISEHGESASGLVREDHLEWPKELAKLLTTEKPALVIVMLGANDRQQMQFGENREKFRSEKWMTEYEQRVGELAKLVTDQKLPLLWVGLPASSHRHSRQMP